MTIERSRLRWNGWGLRDETYDLGNRAGPVWDWLAAELGLAELADTPPEPLEAIELPPGRLGEAELGRLEELLAPDRVRTDPYERAFHAKGRSYHDLVRLRVGRVGELPDAVAYPLSAEEVVALLAWAEEASVAVVPFGGGTSVVGGVEARKGPGQRALVSCDLTRMSALVGVDPEARTATVQAGVYGPRLEELLCGEGMTLGHYPQSFEFSTLGGWIATRGAGQASQRYGKAEDWLVAAELATPRGTWSTRPFPASAAGPDLNQAVAGSEGTLGIITRATVRLHPLPETVDYRGFLFRDFEDGLRGARSLVQEGVPLAMIRLLDADETRFLEAFSSVGARRGLRDRLAARYLRLRGYGRGRCLCIVGAEGARGEVGRALRRTTATARAHGGLPLGRRPGQRWRRDRFRLPYLRDPMMDRGLGVETLETATLWPNLPALHRTVTDALRGAMAERSAFPAGRGISMCHVSHTYPEGASLYFTCVWPRDPEDPVGEWLHIKRAATDAVVDGGGTLSHHHGVGADHLPWMVQEKGAEGMELLRALRERADPGGVLNPGKLTGS